MCHSWWPWIDDYLFCQWCAIHDTMDRRLLILSMCHSWWPWIDDYLFCQWCAIHGTMDRRLLILSMMCHSWWPVDDYLLCQWCAIHDTMDRRLLILSMMCHSWWPWIDDYLLVNDVPFTYWWIDWLKKKQNTQQCFPPSLFVIVLLALSASSSCTQQHTQHILQHTIMLHAAWWCGESTTIIFDATLLGPGVVHVAADIHGSRHLLRAVAYILCRAWSSPL